MKPTPRGRMTAILAVAGIALAAGIAYASIPNAGGVIHACYRVSTDDQKGQLRAVEDPASCRHNEAPLAWNVAGTPGPPGADGADGVFSGTFTSPNGQYSLSVTDTGIVLASPDSSINVSAGAIEIRTLGADEIRVRGGNNVDIESGAGLNMRAGASVAVRAAATSSFESGAATTIRGANVTVNPGTACAAAARAGDMVNPATDRIASGSFTVCIGG